jgi:hypothetical protein
MNRRIVPMLVLAAALGACGDDSDVPMQSGSTTGDPGETGSPGETGDSGETGDAGETGAPDVRPERPAQGPQIDRAGRAAISTATIETFQADAQVKADAKDAYNAAAPDTWSSFEPQMMTSLAILDALDATCGNQLLADAGDTRYAFLASVLADDRLWVHSERGECGTYLGLEAEAIGAIEDGTGGCGGRSPTDDVIETSYSTLAAGLLSGIDDGVSEDDGASPDTFPFLGAP